jgi:hypothetical protein
MNKLLLDMEQTFEEMYAELESDLYKWERAKAILRKRLAECIQRVEMREYELQLVFDEKLEAYEMEHAKEVEELTYIISELDSQNQILQNTLLNQRK